MLLLDSNIVQNIPSSLLSSLLDDTTATNTNSNNMTMTDIHTIVQTMLNNLPYDPHGIDAQLSFGGMYTTQK
jgi:hypothetical protein